MIIQALLIKYHNFIKLELVAQDFDPKFAYNMYKKGWKYLKGCGIFYQTYYKDTIGLERLLNSLDYIRKQNIKVKSIDALKERT